jgi:hypothetical protein
MATQVNICNLALRRMGEQPITLITDSTKRAEHCNAFWDYILDEVLEDYSWEFAKKIVSLDYAGGFGVYVSTDEKTITGITQADPAVVSAASHGFLDGQFVYIYDVSGMTEVNQRVYEVANKAAGTFELLDMDSTDWTAYTSGGKCYRAEVDSRYANGYTYELPADYLKALHLDDKDTEFEVLGATGDNNRRLVTVARDAVLHYTALESTTTNMTNRFISALAWRLAAELAVPLGKKGAKQEWAMGMYSYVLGKKSKADAQTRRRNLDASDPWTDAGGFTV